MLRKRTWLSTVCFLAIAAASVNAGDQRHGPHKDLSFQDTREISGQRNFAEDRGVQQGVQRPQPRNLQKRGVNIQGTGRVDINRQQGNLQNQNQIQQNAGVRGFQPGVLQEQQNVSPRQNVMLGNPNPQYIPPDNRRLNLNEGLQTAPVRQDINVAPGSGIRTDRDMQ